MSATSHPTPAPGSDEQWVREVIDSAMSGSRPPQDLPASALARGRRIRTRRRVGTAAVVAASVLTAVAVPWALAGEDGRAAGGGGDLLATQPATPDQPPTPEGYWDMPTRTMVEELTELLPDGVFMVNTGRLDRAPSLTGRAFGPLNSTLGLGVDGEIVTGNVNLMMWPDADPGVAALEGVGEDGTTFTVGPAETLACPGNLIDPVACTQVLDDTGRVVARRSVSQLGEVRVLEFVLSAGDGFVYGATANTDEEKWSVDSQVTAPRPPLTMAELEAIVRDDVWTSYRP